MEKIPQWDDEAAGLKRVNQEIEGYVKDEEYEFMVHRLPLLPDLTLAEVYAMAIQAAVETAERGGGVADLAALLRSDYPLNKGPYNIRGALTPAILDLMSDFLTGARNPRTGKPKGQRGAPKKSEEERREQNPVHDAADEFPIIRSFVKRLWPEQKEADVRERASTFAAARNGVKDVETLSTHLNRPKNDRRRIK